MNEDQIVLKLQDIIKKYLNVRNNTIKNIVYDLNRIGGDRFLRDVSIKNLMKNNPEIEQILKHSLHLAQQKYRQENRMLEENNIELKGSYINISEQMMNLEKALGEYLDLRKEIKHYVIRATIMNGEHFMEDPRLSGIIANYNEVEKLLKYWAKKRDVRVINELN